MNTNIWTIFCLSKQIWKILQQTCFLLRCLSKSSYWEKNGGVL